MVVEKPGFRRRPCNRFKCMWEKWSADLLFCMLFMILAMGGVNAQGGETIRAASASRADVGSAVRSAKAGDTVIVPAGSATWKATLTITKNVTLIGAGEGRTIITADLPILGSADATDFARSLSSTRRHSDVGRQFSPLIDVSLSHESLAPDYSFRLSGFTLKSTNAVELP